VAPEVQELWIAVAESFEMHGQPELPTAVWEQVAESVMVAGQELSDVAAREV